MRAIPRKRLLAAIAAIGLVGAGSFAAITAAQKGARHPRTALAAASEYLGVGEAQLRGDLADGKSLAQVASATPGRSSQGLIEAIVAARRARLQAQLASLRSRVAAQVQRPGAGAGGARPVAATYLGLTAAQLHQRLRAGATLARIAETTPGRSRAGLVAALLARRRQALSAKVAGGLLTPAAEQARLARAQRLVGERVDGVRRPRGAGGSRHAG